MRENDIVARQTRRFVHTTDSRHEHPIAPTRSSATSIRKHQRDLAGDVTYIATEEGWLCVAVNDRQLALEALGHAVRSRRPASGLVHPTDRASDYASDEYRQALVDRGLVAASCLDPHEHSHLPIRHLAFPP